MQSSHTAKERLGVDVCLTKESLAAATHCPHGKRALQNPATYGGSPLGLVTGRFANDSFRKR